MKIYRARDVRVQIATLHALGWIDVAKMAPDEPMPVVNRWIDLKPRTWQERGVLAEYDRETDTLFIMEPTTDAAHPDDEW